jgi:hypothetical protein
MGDVAPIILAAAALTSSVGGIVIALRRLASLAKGQREIHVLVNSRLSEALAKITELEERIGKLTGK